MWFESMHPSWQRVLANQRHALDELQKIIEASADITPTSELVMKAFELPLDRVRVLLVGQDPYPEHGVAQGLAFAVATDSKRLPASLRNIMTELKADIPGVLANGNIALWASQGVLLLNRHLTTQVGKPGAHANIGWTKFTDAVVEALAANRGGHFVSLLWGAEAGKLRPLLGDLPTISGVHPSPLSAYRGFFGSKPFSKTNELLREINEPPIDWNC